MAGMTHCFRIRMRPRMGGGHQHVHETHEFFYCEAGRGWQHAEDRTLPMKKGELFLFPAGQPHNGRGHADGSCVGLVLNLDADEFAHADEGDREARRVLEALCAAAYGGVNRIPLGRAAAREIGRRLDTMTRELSERPAGHGCAVKAGLLGMLLAVFRDREAAALVGEALAPAPAAARLEGVWRFIDSNYMQPLTVEQLAAMAHLSRSHFHAVFREETGGTFKHYLNSVRVREARRLLAETDLPILEVALGVGFPSLSHFYHVFKRVTGRTPRQARLRSRENA